MAKRNNGKATHKQTKSEKPNPQHLREEIEKLAYRLYCQCGYEHGHDLEHWIEAEQRVLAEYRGKLTSKL